MGYRYMSINVYHVPSYFEYFTKTLEYYIRTMNRIKDTKEDGRLIHGT